jgi:hypothetical protein
VSGVKEKLRELSERVSDSYGTPLSVSAGFKKVKDATYKRIKN